MPIVFLSLLTTFLYLMSKESFAVLSENPLISISQYLGLVGATLLSSTYILSSRLPGLEAMFGGMGRVYKLHRITASLSYVFLLNHPLFLVFNALSIKIPVTTFLLPGRMWQLNFGIFALYLLTILLILTLLVKLPYNIWKITHWFMIFVLVFAFLHVLRIPSDVSSYLPLRYWMIFLMTLGFISYLFRLFFYHAVFRHKFTINSINVSGNVYDIRLLTKGKRLDFKPGQFVFVKFLKKGFSGEEHPFSISSSPLENMLRLSVKQLGDFTQTLDKLSINDSADVYGPHGSFLSNISKCNKALFVGGGIGITPFLSVLNSEVIDKTFNVTVIYSVKNISESYANNELKKLSKTKSFRYVLWDSSVSGKVSAQNILEKVEDAKDLTIFLCGPRSMMFDLTRQFVKLGVSKSKIYFEDFSLR